MHARSTRARTHHDESPGARALCNIISFACRPKQDTHIVHSQYVVMISGAKVGAFARRQALLCDAARRRAWRADTPDHRRAGRIFRFLVLRADRARALFYAVPPMCDKNALKFGALHAQNSMRLGSTGTSAPLRMPMQILHTHTVDCTWHRRHHLTRQCALSLCWSLNSQIYSITCRHYYYYYYYK